MLLRYTRQLRTRLFQAMFSRVGWCSHCFVVQWRIQDCSEGVRFLDKKSDDLFLLVTLYMHIFVLNSTPLNLSLLPHLPFRVTLDSSPHQILPPPYKNCFKKFFISDGCSSEPNELPLDPPPVVILLQQRNSTVRGQVSPTF